ncbi:HAD domain-containing protein [uncultured Bradyrhizobium sp.]|uniref:HAD domain-containing protein n=1 Tax=uncultured Bradyrhizobium sp. TaxID=199684 RepID=UPI0035CB16A2
MKVIFLDIDGVLNCDATPNPRHFPYVVDNRLLCRFRDLVQATGATVVLSSTWRVDPVGLLAATYHQVPFDDVCPDMPGAPRCDELWSWLRNHLDATRYVVLDDSNDCLDELPLFQPSARTGLTDDIAKGIEEFLAGRTDQDMRAGAITRLGQNFHALFGRDKS